MNCSSVPCSSSLPPLPREPITMSALSALIGPTSAGMSFGSCEPSASKRLAFAFAAVELDAGAAFDRDVARAVRRMAVDHEDFVGVRTHAVDDFADQPFFVFCRDDNGDAGGT